jgi:hypothetical protein
MKEAIAYGLRVELGWSRIAELVYVNQLLAEVGLTSWHC